MTTQVPAALGLSPHDTAAVLQAAGLAPSVHNTQPWRFRVTPDVIELHTDPTRRLAVADPEDVELRLACGAALFNLRLALQGYGIRPDVARFPDRDRPGLVAEVRRGGLVARHPDVTRLLAALPRRRTNRHPFTDVPVESSEQHELLRAAAEEGAHLDVVRNRGRRRNSASSRRPPTDGRRPTPRSGRSWRGGPAPAVIDPTVCRHPRAAPCQACRTGGCCATSPAARPGNAYRAATSRTSP